jgi:hypothetical protein
LWSYNFRFPLEISLVKIEEEIITNEKGKKIKVRRMWKTFIIAPAYETHIEKGSHDES